MSRNVCEITSGFKYFPMPVSGLKLMATVYSQKLRYKNQCDPFHDSVH